MSETPQQPEVAETPIDGVVGGGGGHASEPGVVDPNAGVQPAGPAPGVQPAPGGPPPADDRDAHGVGDPSGPAPGGDPAAPGPGGIPGEHGRAVDPAGPGPGPGPGPAPRDGGQQPGDPAPADPAPSDRHDGEHGAHDARHEDSGPDVEYVQVPHPHHAHPGGSGGDGVAVSIEPGSVHATAGTMRACAGELRDIATRVAPHAMLTPFAAEARAALEERLHRLLATIGTLVEELEHEAADLAQRASQAEADGLDAPSATSAEWAAATHEPGTEAASAMLGGGAAAAAGGIAGHRLARDAQDEDGDADDDD